MSTNSECMFIEIEPSKWYYILENYHAPQNSWDWREHATCTGPFVSFDKADKHLGDNHANPGGFVRCPYVEHCPPDLENDEVLKNLIENAIKPIFRRW